jgi:P27 family predicted phage terminase small subunit
MAGPAAAGRKAAPPGLRLLQGRGDGKDSAGRKIPETPKFDRTAKLEKPADLSPDAEWLWDRVIDQVGGMGLLKPIDAASLEVMCETFARWREAAAKRKAVGLLGKNAQGIVTAPWIGIEERASKEFRSWCAEYGITPAAEKNLAGAGGGNGDDPDNPY